MKPVKLSTILFFWVGSLLLTTTLWKKGSGHNLHPRVKKKESQICKIIQTGPEREALPTECLAEILGLSSDAPLPSRLFQRGTLQKKLLGCPVIEKAEVRLYAADTLYIDYTVRKPVAWLYDFENAAIDEAGVVFPVTPFFSPKTLPEVYLGIQKVYWGEKIKLDRLRLGLQILQQLEEKGVSVARIDLSKMEAKKLAEREIVILCDERVLRVAPSHVLEQLGNYMNLRPALEKEQTVIDLRVEGVAFIPK